jgi:hypothetical protein
MIFTVPSIGGFEIKPYSSLVLRILTKYPRNKKLESIHEYNFVERKNEGTKRDRNSNPKT